MRPFKKIYAGITTIILAAVAFAGISGSGSALATSGSPVKDGSAVTVEQVANLLLNFSATGWRKGAATEVTDFVADVTLDPAIDAQCAYDRDGEVLAPEGDAYAAKLANAYLDAKGKAKGKAAARLSWYTGFCYLWAEGDDSTPNVYAARSGAVARIALALSGIEGSVRPIATGDGTYAW